MDNQNQEKYDLFAKSISNQINQDIQKHFTESEVNQLNNNHSKAAHRFYTIGGALIALGVVIRMILFLDFFHNLKFFQSFGSATIFWIFIIIGVIFLIIGFMERQKTNKFLDYFSDPQHISDYYVYYSKLFYPEILINKVDYEVNPNQTLKLKDYYRSYINPQLHGTYKGYDFSIGTQTLIQRHVVNTQNGSRVHYTYNEHLIATIKTDEINFNTVIEPETTFTRIFKSQKTKNQALESQEFEKKFKLNYDDPIKLRKLLSPRVMVNLLDLSDQQTIPKLVFENNHLMIHKIINKGNCASYKNPKKTFFTNVWIKNIKNQEDIKKIIENVIVQDFDKINKVILWAEAFKLYSKYDIKILIKDFKK